MRFFNPVLVVLGLGSVAHSYENPQVSLDYGSFQGQYDATYNLSYFRKIPFAAPPIGENRFRAPQPPLKITDVYDANQDFDMCPQRTVNGTEDCLYLARHSQYPRLGFNSSDASLHEWVTGFLPELSPKQIAQVESIYYPAVGSTETIESYNTSYVRAGLIYRDVVLACPAYWIASASSAEAYLGEYTISPATHGSDTIYWNRINAVQQTNPVVYEGYAGAFASFFQTGDPNAHKVTNSSQPGVPELKHTGKEFVVVDEGFENVKLVELKRRCDFWRKLAKKIPV